MKRVLFFTILTAILLPITAPAANLATLTFNPSSGFFITGGAFNVSVVLDTGGQAANIVELELLFPTNKLQLLTPIVNRPLIPISLSPPSFSNSEGRLYFAGGAPAPGINDSNGIVLTFTFQAVAPGDATVSFGKNTRVLANDGYGTNILGRTVPALYTIAAASAAGPKVQAPTPAAVPQMWYDDVNMGVFFILLAIVLIVLGMQTVILTMMLWQFLRHVHRHSKGLVGKISDIFGDKKIGIFLLLIVLPIILYSLTSTPDPSLQLGQLSRPVAAPEFEAEPLFAFFQNFDYSLFNAFEIFPELNQDEVLGLQPD